MTIRRINHTGRTRIKQEHVTVTVTENAPRRSEFAAKLDLSGYDFPQDAAVFVEAYALSVCQRFSFGRIGNFSPPAELRLSEFDNVDALKFRVKVVQLADGNKHILAEADKITARKSDENGARTPLLPVIAAVGPSGTGRPATSTTQHPYNGRVTAKRLRSLRYGYARRSEEISLVPKSATCRSFTISTPWPTRVSLSGCSPSTAADLR